MHARPLLNRITPENIFSSAFVLTLRTETAPRTLLRGQPCAASMTYTLQYLKECTSAACVQIKDAGGGRICDPLQLSAVMVGNALAQVLCFSSSAARTYTGGVSSSPLELVRLLIPCTQNRLLLDLSIGKDNTSSHCAPLPLAEHVG